MALRKTVFIGPFIHCVTPTELEICTTGSIGVNEDGRIAFVSRHKDDRQSRLDDKGWKDAKVVRIQNHSFVLPGFVGM